MDLYSTDEIYVLHVDDDPSFGELTATFLEQVGSRLSVATETTVDDAFDHLDTGSVDCIVSDYDMPDATGLEFLTAVRERDEQLPFILFTGKGSEEIASEAISAGVSDYLQKKVGVHQYTVLANRIENLVSQFRATKAVDEQQKRFSKLVRHSSDVISIVDGNGEFQYLTPSSSRILGYDPDELVGEVGFDYVHPDDRLMAIEQFTRAVEQPESHPTVEFRFRRQDGSWTVLENTARNLIDDPVIGGFVVHTRDISDRKEHERQLERQNERLDEFASVVTHELRNPLSVASGYLRVYREASDPDESHLDRVDGSLRRIDQIIDDLLTLARDGERITDGESVDLAAVVADAWANVDTEDATLRNDATGTICADPSRLQRLLENLFRNAIEHGADADPATDATARELTVRVGRLADGFFVEDDGVGIDGPNRDRVFESGYTTNQHGTGFGLAIVEQIVAAHDWRVAVTEGTRGGARFDVTAVRVDAAVN